jgi:hypothetical protein
LLKAALAGRITNAQGARALRLSVRQFRRLKKRFREGGARAGNGRIGAEGLIVGTGGVKDGSGGHRA